MQEPAEIPGVHRSQQQRRQQPSSRQQQQQQQRPQQLPQRRPQPRRPWLRLIAPGTPVSTPGITVNHSVQYLKVNKDMKARESHCSIFIRMVSNSIPYSLKWRVTVSHLYYAGESQYLIFIRMEFHSILYSLGWRVTLFHIH